MDNQVTATLRLQVKEEVTKEMAKARGELERFQKQSVSLRGTVRDLFREFAGPAAGAGVAAGLGMIVRSSLEAGSALQAMERRADAVFGDALPRIQGAVGRLADETRRSASDLLDYSTTFASVGQGFGFGAEAVNDMSVELTRLTADFASYFNISDQQAFEDLRGGILGSTRALGQYGIVVKETTLQNYAHAQGIKTQVKDMNDAQLAALRYGFIVEEAGGKVRDAAKDTGSLGNQTKALKGEWQDLMEELGRGGIPAAVKVIGSVTDALHAARTSIGGFIRDFQTMGKVIGTYGGMVTGKAGDPNMPPVWQRKFAQMEASRTRAAGGMGSMSLNDSGLSFRPADMVNGLDGVADAAAGAQSEVAGLVDSLSGNENNSGGGGGGSNPESDALAQAKEILSDIERIERGILDHVGKQVDANRKLKEGHRENLKLKKETGQITRDELRDLDTLNRRLGDGREQIDELKSGWDRQVDAVRRAKDEVERFNDEIERGGEAIADTLARIDRETGKKKAEKIADLITEKAGLESQMARGEGLSGKEEVRLREVNELLRKAKEGSEYDQDRIRALSAEKRQLEEYGKHNPLTLGQNDRIAEIGGLLSKLRAGTDYSAAYSSALELNKLDELQKIDFEAEQKKREAALDFNDKQEKGVQKLVQAQIDLATAEGTLKTISADLVTAMGTYETSLRSVYESTEEVTRRHVAGQVAALDQETAAVNRLAAAYSKVAALKSEKQGSSAATHAPGGSASLAREIQLQSLGSSPAP